MKRIIFGVVSIVMICQMMSCASITGRDFLNIKTNPPDVTAIMADNEGTIIGTEIVPKQIEIPNNADYIEFKKTDYLPQQLSVKRKFNHAFWLNFLISGLSIGGGLLYNSRKQAGIVSYPPETAMGQTEKELRNEAKITSYAIMGIGGAIGIAGALYDIFTGNTKKIEASEVSISMQMTPEAVAARATRERAAAQEVAQENERREAAERAREEANRYDSADFTVVPDNFKPANYVNVDLFKAVANSRNLQMSASKLEALSNQMKSAFVLGLGGIYILDYVSDLTFVRQNGTDITFSSDENDITQSMTIDQRSGLQAGQKVRVYYTIMKTPFTTWDVIAIERR